MRICLIDIDSKIPNIALMKLSTYHKQRGDEVIFNFPLAILTSDKTYISVIFEKNREQAENLRFNDSVVIGGSGSGDYSITLPEKIESLMPDYDLYGCDYSIGFTTRGCIRRCPFCVVPKKEGNFRIVGDIYSLWDRKHKKIVLLDNNILANKDHFLKIAGQLQKESLFVDFNQGLDFRLLDTDICEALKKLRNGSSCHGQWRFAFDNPKDIKLVEEKLQLMKKYKIRGFWYVLAGYNTTVQEDLDRLNFLRRHKQNVYLMRYELKPELIELARWANTPGVFYKMTYEEHLSFLRKAA